MEVYLSETFRRSIFESIIPGGGLPSPPSFRCSHQRRQTLPRERAQSIAKHCCRISDSGNNVAAAPTIATETGRSDTPGSVTGPRRRVLLAET